MTASARSYIVHGAGAIGSVVAARLSQAGCAVSLIARGEHLAALRADGLRIGGRTKGVFKLPSASSASELSVDAATIVILAMKTQDTFAAVEAHSELYADLPILCFQNGVSNEEWLAERGFNTYGVMVRIGARIDEPGMVTHTGARQIAIGRWPTGSDELCEQVRDDLLKGDLNAVVEPRVKASKWGKLVVNLSNAYLALTDQSVQGAFADNDTRAFVADLTQEALDVLVAAKIEAVIDDGSNQPVSVAEHVERLRKSLRDTSARPDKRARDSQESYPSTWQDLQAGRRNVEVDHFNGRIVELGEQVGVATPLNKVLWERCKNAADNQLGPGTETEATIRAAAVQASSSSGARGGT